MLRCSIDPEAPGKSHGYLGLIHSDHRHAHSIIPVPITVINGGAGPTALITAGVHGDEYAGIVAVRQLIEELRPGMVSGRVILMPQLNTPACQADCRVSPLDGGNLNRVFPGSATGAPTEQIAHHIEEVLLPQVDFVLDIHSGGTTATYLPSAFIYGRRDSLMPAKVKAAKAFGAGITLLVEAPLSAGSLLGACDRKGVTGIAAEISGGATLQNSAISMARAGIYRLLHHWNLISSLPDDVSAGDKTRFVKLSFGPESAIVAPVDGAVVPQKEIGDRVGEGELAARLFPMDDFSRPPTDLRFGQDCIITSMIARAFVSRGDFIYLTGIPVDLSDYLQAPDS